MNFPYIRVTWPTHSSFSTNAENLMEKIYATIPSFEPHSVEEHTNGIDIYFSDYTEAQNTLTSLKTMDSALTVTLLSATEEDWIQDWKNSWSPTEIIPDLWVCTSWNISQNTSKYILIEPEMAFGTGTHPSTRLAAKGLHHVTSNPDSKIMDHLDIGAGSGVLCFLANALNIPNSVGLEIDMNCFSNLIKNQGLNAFQSSPSFIMGNTTALHTKIKFDIITLNMFWKRSSPLIPDCLSLISSKGFFIWSGLYLHEKDKAIQLLSQHHWSLYASNLELDPENSNDTWWSGIFVHSS